MTLGIVFLVNVIEIAHGSDGFRRGALQSGFQVLPFAALRGREAGTGILPPTHIGIFGLHGNQKL